MRGVDIRRNVPRDVRARGCSKVSCEVVRDLKFIDSILERRPFESLDGWGWADETFQKGRAWLEKKAKGVTVT